MKIVGVIPARYASTRFPGKPLADICGKPMIWWVYQQAKKVKELDEVYVAIDDERIQDVCERLGMEYIMTSSKHPTGTDRVAEVARKIVADIYVNIQGDEPLINPDSITKVITPFIENKKIQVTNLMCKIKNPVDVTNCTIPKVITNKDNRGIFLTRTPAPYPKGSLDFFYYKQVCAYGFRKESLELFSNTPRGTIEIIEDIEILRFIENNIFVQFIEVDSSTVAVDTEKDLEIVRQIVQMSGCKL